MPYLASVCQVLGFLGALIIAVLEFSPSTTRWFPDLALPPGEKFYGSALVVLLLTAAVLASVARTVLSGQKKSEQRLGELADQLSAHNGSIGGIAENLAAHEVRVAALSNTDLDVMREFVADARSLYFEWLTLKMRYKHKEKDYDCIRLPLACPGWRPVQNVPLPDSMSLEERIALAQMLQWVHRLECHVEALRVGGFPWASDLARLVAEDLPRTGPSPDECLRLLGEHVGYLRQKVHERLEENPGLQKAFASRLLSG